MPSQGWASTDCAFVSWSRERRDGMGREACVALSSPDGFAGGLMKASSIAAVVMVAAVTAQGSG